MEDILRAKQDELKAALDGVIPEVEFKKLEKQCQTLAEEISEYAYSDVKENLSQWITDHIRNHSQLVVEALLAGDMRTVKQYLKIEDQWGQEDYGRREWVDRPWFNGSGRLHEFGGVELRHKIVDAHKDLITDERIKDLELQMAGLIKKFYPMEFGGALGITREVLKTAVRFLPKERDDPELCALLKRIEDLVL